MSQRMAFIGLGVMGRRMLTHIDDPRREGYHRMLDNFLALLEGRENSMPTFRQALPVQELVEDMLKP